MFYGSIWSKLWRFRLTSTTWVVSKDCVKCLISWICLAHEINGSCCSLTLVAGNDDISTNLWYSSYICSILRGRINGTACSVILHTAPEVSVGWLASQWLAVLGEKLFVTREEKKLLYLLRNRLTTLFYHHCRHFAVLVPTDVLILSQVRVMWQRKLSCELLNVCTGFDSTLNTPKKLH